MSNNIKRYVSNNRLSQIVKLDNYIETSGIVAECKQKDIIHQTQSVLDQLEQRLKMVGADKNSILKIQIWLADMNDFDDMNLIYEQWFDGFYKPARACVGANLADLHYRIEIQASAAL
ncbi:RidA family protein [Acinetobacter pseudolwoffii]|uniref:RidA family protein n=1 Tax=Acinetobacter pseudolwoffii TaxID=2053287 RepID=UPI0039894E48